MKRLSNQIGALTTLKQLNLDENQLDRVRGRVSSSLLSLWLMWQSQKFGD
jgi:hypothetical protein